jgi:serine/threonine protein kinase
MTTIFSALNQGEEGKPEFLNHSFVPQPGTQLQGVTLQGQLKVVSAEADLWLGVDDSQEQCIVKIYRAGVSPALSPALLCSLEHPHVVHTRASEVKDGRYYEILDYFPLKGLNTFFEQAFTVEQATDLLKQLSDGLHYLHTHRIQHRDLKPSNVLVKAAEGNGPARRLTVAISDFGTSANNATTALTNVRGTLLYSSPEALTGTYAQASDWWSLGIIVLEAFLGRHPLAHLSGSRQHFALAAGEIPIPADLQGTPLYPILLGLLKADHTERWDYEHIQTALQGQPIAQQPDIQDQYQLAYQSGYKQESKSEPAAHSGSDDTATDTPPLTLVDVICSVVMIGLLGGAAYAIWHVLSAASPVTEAESFSPITGGISESVSKLSRVVNLVLYLVGGVNIAAGGFRLFQGDIPGFSRSFVVGLIAFLIPVGIGFLT